MTRFAWLLGSVLVLAALGMLLACSSLYNRSADGLMLVGSAGSALIQTFSFSLASGTTTVISNPTSDTTNLTCVLPGIPGQMLLDPAGTFAYTIITSVNPCPGSANGILALKVNPDGTIAKSGTVTPDPNPIALTMDSAGKFLFVAEGLGTVAAANQGSQIACQQTLPPPPTAPMYGVCIYAIGSGGSLTNVAQTFTLIPQAGFQTSNFVALALTPTIFPGVIDGTQTAACLNQAAPTTEYLYMVDQPNNAVWQFSVDIASGLITPSPIPVVATDQIPAGVAVDPCNRFVYVTDSLSGKLSAYTICNATALPPCPNPDGHLLPVPNSPFALNGPTVSPGPVVVDPLGNNVYVVDSGGNRIFTFHIGQVTGAVTAGNPPTVATGQMPTQIAIRSDGNWMFVSNFNSGTVSQFSITPATGALSPFPDITTDNQPTGIAVK